MHMFYTVVISDCQVPIDLPLFWLITDPASRLTCRCAAPANCRGSTKPEIDMPANAKV